MMTGDWLAGLALRRQVGGSEGITSVCSAHRWVIEAALVEAGHGPVLLEATCNQVNQDGGYTGMTPRDFRRFVEEVARTVGFDLSQIVLGGDHLGPNPWRSLPAAEAMDKAETMIGEYVSAGFAKVHLDASMGCRGEPAALPDEVVADRASRLAARAEIVATEKGLPAPLYVIGTEVPVPGGARHTIERVEVTAPAAAEQTLAVHRAAFVRRGIGHALDRVIALVVQPGVEFDHERVVAFQPREARALSAVLNRERGLVFEAHSTDYQTTEALRALVRQGFAILKVGPALTFAMREALYGLDCIAGELVSGWADRSLRGTMERLMLAEPRYWAPYYSGGSEEQHVLRHYSYSDRIRYYWPYPEAQAAVRNLVEALDNKALPETLISQFLPRAYTLLRERQFSLRPRALVQLAVTAELDRYRAAASR